MNRKFDIHRRKKLEALLAIVACNVLYPTDDAEAGVDPTMVLGLINALVSLYSISVQRDIALSQIRSGIEMPNYQRYNDFNMQESDPNKIMQAYAGGGTLPMSNQESLSREATLTVQNGIPYLHGYNANKEESNINRWEASEFSKIAREETGTLPIPTSIRHQADARERNTLERKEVDTNVWAPSYIRQVRIGNAKSAIIMATNGKTKKAFWV